MKKHTEKKKVDNDCKIEKSQKKSMQINAIKMKCVNRTKLCKKQKAVRIE